MKLFVRYCAYCILLMMSLSGFSNSKSEINKLPKNAVWLESFNLSSMTSGWGLPQAGKSINEQLLSINGVSFKHGVGTHAPSEFLIVLDGAALKFASYVGIDDDVKKGDNKGNRPFATVNFSVWVDGEKVAESGKLTYGSAPFLLTAELKGAKKLLLVADDGGDDSYYDDCDWANAYLVLDPSSKTKPYVYVVPDTLSLNIATTDNSLVSINNPGVIGCSPGRDFIFRIPATGIAPLSFTAVGLPQGLILDSQNGIISGKVNSAGTYNVSLALTASNGNATKNLKIVCAKESLALTPPMGWNSWNVWGLSVDAQKIKEAADLMVSSGLAAHGFQYINIDDGWEAGRNESGEILTNEKFPDMKALADYVHSKGLKLGIYSSPGPKTCGGFEGSYLHEEQDVKTYEKWGIDYLKYDMCSYSSMLKDVNDSAENKKPYRVMRRALDKADRDIVFSLCQYGWANVWEWGSETGGNLWRTTDDIRDNWSSLREIGFSQTGHENYSGPGHWNDPDMLVVGKVGWGPTLRNTGLKPDEQITHITLWSMLSAPLLIGCDMSQLDSFTLNLLTNDEVLAINQDPLGKQGKCILKNSFTEIWTKELYDGNMAVSIFNLSVMPEKVDLTNELGISNGTIIRDVWQRKDVGHFNNQASFEVPIHGAVLLKIINAGF